MSKLPALLVIKIIKLYQLIISPIIQFLGIHCRYQPTCSQYMLEAIKEFGLLKGGFKGLKRFLSCNPFGGHGYDPVQKRNKKK